MKPEIVFFGEQLPPDFFKNRMLPFESDLVIVLGTSLTVQPFASLPGMTKETTPRVLINKERVGGFGSGTDDVLLIGDCDEGVRRLAEACGWLDELEALWAKTAPKDAKEITAPTEEKKKDKDEALEDEIEKLTKEVDQTLNLSKWHEDKVRNSSFSQKIGGKDGDSVQSAASRHEDKNSSLNHVFVSTDKNPEASETPVIPQDDAKPDRQPSEPAVEETTAPESSKEAKK